MLELLIAVAVFSIVLAAMNAVFYGALRLRNKTVQNLEQTSPIHQTIGIVKRDLANVVPPGGILAGEFQSSASEFSNQPGITFYTSTEIRNETLPWPELQKVSYFLLPSTNGHSGMHLVRLVTRNLLPNTEEQSIPEYLLDHVQALLFGYFDGAQWQDSWDSTVEENQLPEAVKIQLLIGTGLVSGERANTSYEWIVPILTQARTHQMEQGSSTMTR